jgi:transcription initiation factor TFIIIB Brf1 subunit/transcription initiation factor TFIIB
MSQNFRETRVDIQSDCQYSSKSKSILPDLVKYDQFSDDIKNKANNIYIKMNHTTKRAKKRTLLLFFCVHNAYKELDIDVDPADLGDIFGLKAGQLQKTESMFSHLQTDYKPIVRIRSLSDYIRDYCVKIGLEDHHEEILQLSNHILESNKDLKQSPTQPLAAGMIKYYMKIHGIELVNKTDLATAARRSETTIDAMYKQIAKCDNV